MDINEIAYNILKEQDQIVDLFCKTFIVSQEPKTMEALRWMFENLELECKICNDFTRTYRLKLRDEKFKDMADPSENDQRS